jgi:hypothetical protein
MRTGSSPGSREAIELELGEAPLAADAVHDLQLAGAARHRPSEPPGPCGRFFGVARERNAAKVNVASRSHE